MAEQALAPVPAAPTRSAPLGPGDADRLFGYVFPVAIGAVAIQAALHLGNAIVLDNRVSSFDADHEGNLIAWAGSSAIFAAACAAGILALVRSRDRLLLGLLAAAVAFLSLDETAALHERVGQAGVRVLGLSDDDYGRVIWPIVLFPLLAGVVLVLWRLADRARAAPRQAIRVGLALLVVAVVAELAWAAFPISGGEIGSAPDALAVSLEEGLELGGWLLVAAGVAAIALAEVLDLAARRERSP
jgi:hypothetical protein